MCLVYENAFLVCGTVDGDVIETLFVVAHMLKLLQKTIEVYNITLVQKDSEQTASVLWKVWSLFNGRKKWAFWRTCNIFIADFLFVPLHVDSLTRISFCRFCLCTVRQICFNLCLNLFELFYFKTKKPLISEWSV